MEFKNEIDDECGFHVIKTEGFCSPPSVVNKLKILTKKVSNEDSQITVDFDIIKNNNNVLDVLKERYNCDSESCVLNNHEVKRYVNPDTIDTVLKENFKPLGPRLTKEWLSNFDIDDVLDQVKKKYERRNFFHIPFQMRDFEKTGGELAKFNWSDEYAAGFRTFGTVMNTDYSTGKGIHWFAIFGDFSDDLEVFTVEYFNSSGELPLPEVTAWMKKFKHSLNFSKPVKDLVVTRIINQQSSSECGLYSLYYIISRLHGVPWEWFSKNRVKDKVMYEFRKYLFRDKNKK